MGRVGDKDALLHEGSFKPLKHALNGLVSGASSGVRRALGGGENCHEFAETRAARAANWRRGSRPRWRSQAMSGPVTRRSKRLPAA